MIPLPIPPSSYPHDSMIFRYTKQGTIVSSTNRFSFKRPCYDNTPCYDDTIVVLNDNVWEDIK